MQKGIGERCSDTAMDCFEFETLTRSRQPSVRFFESNIAMIQFGSKLNVQDVRQHLKSLNLKKIQQRHFVQQLTRSLNQQSIQNYANKINHLTTSGVITFQQPIAISNSLLIRFKPEQKAAVAHFFLEPSPTKKHNYSDQPDTLSSREESLKESSNREEAHKENSFRKKAAKTEPNDNSPALDTIGLTPELQQATDSITIALVDSGVSTHHQELSHLKQLVQYNPKDNSLEVKDTGFGHGTGVLSLMAASNQHDLRIGALPNANYLSCNGLPSGSYRYPWVISCFDWLLKQPKVDVIVNSWLQPRMSCNSELLYSLQLLWLANSIPVFASGNFGNDDVKTRDPINFRLFNDVPLVSVGATNSQGQPLSQSSHSLKQCDTTEVNTPTLSAPGDKLQVASPFQQDSYQQISGTSYAVTYVASALAVLLNQYPEIPNLTIVQALLSSASPPRDATEDPKMGHGIVNIGNAIQKLEELKLSNSHNQ